MACHLCTIYDSTDSDDNEDYGFDMPWPFGEDEDDVEFKINIPDGIVMAYSKIDPTKLLWQHKVCGTWLHSMWGGACRDASDRYF